MRDGMTHLYIVAWCKERLPTSSTMSSTGDGRTSPTVVCVKEEQEWYSEIKTESVASDAASSFYAEHEVKGELVLGPERLQPQDFAYTIQQSLHSAESYTVKQEPALAAGAEAARPGDAPRSGKSCGEQVALRTCSVRLERILVDKELHACTICHKTFLQECSLKTHLRIHSAETSSNIKNCKNLFVVKKKKSYSCDFCGKGLTSKGYLVRHIRIHMEKKPLLCNFCHKEFKCNSALARHKRTHTGEKPYSCNVCNKLFPYGSTLATHIVTHMKVKPFSCNICDKQFLKQASLDNHKEIHTGDPFHAIRVVKRFYERLL